MKLQDVLEKLRRAEKITVKDQKGSQLFCGTVNRIAYRKELVDREVDFFYPEILHGMVVELKDNK